MSKILIVEDDLDINKLEERLLQKNQYETVSAFSGTEALLQLERDAFDLILLDLMLPGLNGESVLREVIRKRNTPVICVSAKDALDTRLTMLRDGADDYIVKPFHNDELLVRVAAVLRRTQNKVGTDGKTCSYKDIIMDLDCHKVVVDHKEVELTSKEYQILQLLLENPNKVFTKENIFESVWSEEYLADDNAVTVHVSNLRSKLSEDKNKYIKTVWGIGYKMQDL